ncbi:NAD(P)H-hydrate dehydratase [Candidatus Woesearchaeota archaeon]|nr:NAD(P)H-hydrate dehydratase [Candidatus Woesearchaeota archaeon]
MYYITKSQIKLPTRKKDSHKGDNGTVLIVGGSKDYVGAVTLAGLAALRSGADLVKIVAPEKVAWAINSYSPDLVTKKFSQKIFLPEHFYIIKKEIEKFDVLLIGNGVGLNSKTKEFCKKTIKNIKKFKIIDADAIKSISMNDVENSIITPHSKELEYFLKNSNIDVNIIKKISRDMRVSSLRTRSQATRIFFSKAALIKKITQKFLDKNNIILLKGRIDVIISKNKILYNKTGNSGMTKGGTGDVLAGLCAGFLAQSKDLLQSTINAAYFNGLIGDILLKKKRGFTYLASDMVEEVKKIKYKNF